MEYLNFSISDTEDEENKDPVDPPEEKDILEEIDAEIKELLLNYKSKKATTYEPCTATNWKTCLLSLHDELSLVNINYVFNPHLDVTDEQINVGAIVNLINAVWALIHHYKTVADNVTKFKERNYTLEQNNKHLNNLVNKLKRQSLESEKESRACISEAEITSKRATNAINTLAEARATIFRLSKQKDAIERSLKNEVTRLKLECDRLRDKFRDKCGTYLSSSDAATGALDDLRIENRKLKAINKTLQSNNRQLMEEIVALKDELLILDNPDT